MTRVEVAIRHEQLMRVQYYGQQRLPLDDRTHHPKQLFTSFELSFQERPRLQL